MRSKNPEVMNAICTFVDQYYREHHASPSVNEIAQGVGVSKATSYRYLVAMNERGMLSYDGKTIVTKQVGKCTSGYFSAPVVGSIRCGDPEREEESVEEYVSLPKSIFGEGKFYILRAKGDSMVGYSCAGVPLFRRNGYRQSSGRKPLFRNRDTALN